MRIRKISSLITIGLLALGSLSQAQTAFHRYALLVSVTGGPARAQYSTRDNSSSGISDLKYRESIRGEADPLIVEFGITNRIGIGFSMGGDAFRIDANKFYNYRAADDTKKIMSSTHYVSMDVSFHPYVTKHFDISTYLGMGSFKVDAYDNTKWESQIENQSTNADQGIAPGGCYEPSRYYAAKGSIIRAGVNARYYFRKRFGVMAMLTGFTGAAKPKGSTEYSFGNNYSTIVTGYSAEFGLCFRFF